MRVFEIDNKRYIYVQRLQYNLLLKDDIVSGFKTEIATTVGVFVLFLVLFLYYAILRKLFPLKRLHKEIEAFGRGDKKPKITYETNDEIGKIAKSFQDAMQHINELSDSKALFMRNLMHELKTPITKGRIVAEMIEDDNSKKSLINAFERMNELISELAEVERVTTQKFDTNIEKIKLSEVIQRASRLLLTDKSKLEVHLEDRTLNTDIKLLALALKNLFDNGIKYSFDNKVIFQTKKERMEILSNGQSLKYPLSYYLEPFSQEEKRSVGFGLGLYIVHSILEKLGLKLEYRHEDGVNVFTVS